MGFMPNPGGLKVRVYDKTGKQTGTFHATRCLFTTRKQLTNTPPSSEDWLKQIYVADSDQGLAQILQREPMAHEEAAATSGGSLRVTVCMAKRGNRAKVSRNQTVIATGKRIPGKPKKKLLFLTTELHVSPVKIGKGHPLLKLWEEQIGVR